MFSDLLARRWVIASTVLLLVGCGSEALEEERTQEPVQSSEEDIVGGIDTTIEATP